MKAGIVAAVSVLILSCAREPGHRAAISAGPVTTAPTSVLITRAVGDVQLGPIEISRVRLRPLSGPSGGFYAEPGGVYGVAPGVAIELWAEWSSSTALGAPPRLVVDWGDGTQDNIHCGPCRLEHAYGVGQYVVQVLLDDRVGGTTRRTFNLSVRDAAEPPPTQTVTRVFSNPGLITIPTPIGCAETAANTYPATISVSGVTGTITRVNVTFFGFSTQDTNLLALVVAPNGQTVKLLDEAGGGTSITNVDLTFDDDAPSCCNIPDPGPATRKPSTSSNDSPMLPPAPNILDGLQLATLNGTPANGVWQLFLMHHLNCGFGPTTLTGGWSITLTTSN